MIVDYTRQTTQEKATGKSIDAGLRAYMVTVYNYMAAALGVTGLTAFVTASSATAMQTIYGTPLQWLVMFAPLIMVFFLSSRIHKLKTSTAQACFWAFSVLMGVSLSYIFLAYTAVSITRVFFISASVFASMSLYGYTTKKDLSSFGSFLIMGLWGIILASIVNMFLGSTALQMAISVIGVLVFVGLTAYDTQKIKDNYFMIAGHGEAMGKASIMAALTLYLDFINLFIMLLHLFGDRR